MKMKKKKKPDIKKKKRVSSSKSVNKKRKNRKNRPKKVKRKWWKKLLSFFIVCCCFGVFAVFAFCIYIVSSCDEFNPNALANQDQTIIYDSQNNIIAELGIEKREKVTLYHEHFGVITVFIGCIFHSQLMAI